MAANNDSQSDILMIKEFIKKALAIKYIYFLCLILGLSLAYVVSKFSTPVYEVNSIIGPLENEQTRILGSSELFRGLEAYTQARNLQDDVNSVKSFSLATSTITSLNLEVGYFIEGNKLLQKTIQEFPRAPYVVNIDKSHIQPINVKFYIQFLNASSYSIKAFSENAVLYNYVDNMVVGSRSNFKIDTICKFNETITHSNYKFAVSANPDFSSIPMGDPRHYFEFFHLDNLTKQYLSRISVSPVNIRSSLINVKFKGENIDLTVEYLNRYLQTFLDENLSKKNKIAVNTINFIDAQISEISDSLLISETELRDYRSTNQVTDLSYQGQQALEQMARIESDLSSISVQQRYYDYILDYIGKNQDVAGLAPPSSANVIDPILNTLILDLLEMNAERS
ncbi:MAG: hypothetical protein MUC78_04520, partial [Bacteroidales bacterium]|nr:hypothetical protein [Bacteroidales bacterium]